MIDGLLPVGGVHYVHPVSGGLAVTAPTGLLGAGRLPTGGL
jgi:hypothetical protein